MTLSRESQVSLEATSFYHCYVRCVRRAYLCGTDQVTGDSYDHRKQWLVSQIRFLSYVYAIDVCAYAVLSNHYHVVLHVDKNKALNWTMEEVVERWLQLYKGNLLVERWQRNPESISGVELDKIKEIVEQWRERLFDISWFMRGVNETIARMANEEENCKGRFWEGRFKSQVLLDEAAVLSCMAYVDLNPVRASIAEDLIDSDFTSIQQRLGDYSTTLPLDDNKESCQNEIREKIKKQQQLKKVLQLHKVSEAPLMPFCGSSHTDMYLALPFTQEDYFDLVDTTGRIIREDKRGFMSLASTKLLEHLGIDPSKWIDHVKQFGRCYAKCAGSAENIEKFSEHFQCRWGKGMAASRQLYLKCA